METAETQAASIRFTFQLTAADYYYGLLSWRGLKPWRRWLMRCSYVLMSLTIPAAAILLCEGRVCHPERSGTGSEARRPAKSKGPYLILRFVDDR